MYVTAIHPFASKLGQQSRMDIYHPVVVSTDEEVGNHQQEAGKHNEVDVMLSEQRQQHLGDSKGRTTEMHSFDIQPTGFVQYGRFSLIANHQLHTCQLR